jgi:hypothetical protein
MMNQMLRAVSMTAVLLGAAGAFAQDGQAEQDLRTEEQKVQDALQEAWDNAALQALEASAGATSATPALVEEASEPERARAEPVNEYTEAQAVELLRVLEPGTDTFYMVGPPLQLGGCWYVVKTMPQSQGRYGPPRYLLTVQRLPSRQCTIQWAVLDYSYLPGGTVARKSNKGIAIAMPSKQSPSGSALVHVRLFAFDHESMTASRIGFLGTFMGSTYVNGMRFEGHDLLVDTNRYVARYANFLTSNEPPTGVIFP